MARLSREESKQRTRQLLLEAAKSEFARGGFGGASADLIAERAGFSKGAFYAHFDSKEEIFLELLKRHMEHEARAIAHLMDGASDTAQILKGVEAWFRSLDADAEWRLLSIELLLHSRRDAEFGKRFEQAQSAHRRELGKLIKRFFDHAGRKAPDKPERLGGALMALAHGLALVKTSDDGEQNAAGKLTVLMLQGLLALSKEKG
jgi:AcrR family transcriptional regulator